MTRDTPESEYAPTAYRPDRIPDQAPAARRPWNLRLATLRLPWGNTQDVVPAWFYLKNSPEHLRLCEQEEREDAEKKANGTYVPRMAESMDFHYIYNHQRYRFAQLSPGGRFWNYLYLYGKGFFLTVIILAPFTLIAALIQLKGTWQEILMGSLGFWSLIFGIPLVMWGIGFLVMRYFPKLWVRPSRGPVWELNRQTGMVTIFEYDQYKKNGTIGEFVAPFYEFDAYVVATVLHNVVVYLLCLNHRYQNKQIAFGPLVDIYQDSTEHYALWDYIQNYMDVSQPLPDIPELEKFRHLDPTTAAYDRQHGRNPRYWVDMDDATFKEVLSKLRKAIAEIDTEKRLNMMYLHVRYQD
ncbi:DUF72 domain-containing protein [Metapseudomonas otitidis]|uniref:hypothetical protein n=1 Tax=Metapseudomonas otitidis TaxID=319939 RepID=UPI0013F642F1|nr:hypothetical protein [Pseudomonas otitidis]